jgi:hypothetical protein
MKRLLVGAMALALGAVPATAQSLDDLNIQIHGYATQGFLYSNQNNVLTTHSSDGSPAWDEAVLNLGAQPIPKLRVGVQARYFLLGNYGNTFTLDWAQADYKVDDRFGLRVGKVKMPVGLFNETQDIDPSYMFALLPQGVYSIASRTTLLSVYGGNAYGALKLNQLGTLEYRAFGGVREISGDDGNFLAARESGITLPQGLAAISVGATLRWRLPVQGLMIGASDFYNPQKSAPIVSTPTSGANVTSTNGTITVTAFHEPFYFVKYEEGRFLLAGEFNKISPHQIFALTGQATRASISDDRAWYGMATYKVTGKLTAGSYYNQAFNVAAPLGPKRYFKDWTVSGRYDFNQYLYAKAEEHFIDGTLYGFDTTLNSILLPTTKLTILKFGVSF